MDFIRHILPILITTNLISSELSAPWLAAATANWVASQHKIQFVVIATNHGALGSDEMKSDEMRLGEIMIRYEQFIRVMFTICL